MNLHRMMEVNSSSQKSLMTLTASRTKVTLSLQIDLTQTFLAMSKTRCIQETCLEETDWKI